MISRKSPHERQKTDVRKQKVEDRYMYQASSNEPQIMSYEPLIQATRVSGYQVVDIRKPDYQVTKLSGNQVS
jgi:hypothetical protein